MKWITRERAKVDRIACPWLISRFIDPQPEFLYVPTDQVLAEAATQEGAANMDLLRRDAEGCPTAIFRVGSGEKVSTRKHGHENSIPDKLLIR